MSWRRAVPVLLFGFALTSCGGGAGKATPSSSHNDPPPPPNPGDSPGVVSVLTYHNDLSRSGLNNNESILTTANVNSTQFGKLATFQVDGEVYAQPLYVPNLQIAGATHKVVFVATQHDSVYAFDGSGKSTQPFWHTSLLDNGATPVPGKDPLGIQPEIGITSTPAIDMSSNTLYVVSMQQLAGGHRPIQLHALDLATGAEKFGGPKEIIAQVTGSGAEADANDQLHLTAGCYQRAALALSGGKIFISFGHCKHGWVVTYAAGTLDQTGVYNTTPDGTGGTIWMSGGGPAVDSSGNVYVMTSVDNDSVGPGFLDAFLKMDSNLVPEDFFTPSNEDTLVANDADLGSGAPMILPDNSSAHPHLLVGAGKDGNIYLLDRDAMGSFNADHNNVVQQVKSGTQQWGNFFDTPSYWNGHVYLHAQRDVLRSFTFSNGLLSSAPVATGQVTYGGHGATASISANGNSNGIVWEVQVDQSRSAGPAVLHAYDALTLKHLYSSADNSTRDAAGPAVKFVVPTVADGHVFVGSSHQVTVYGLLN
ncbi:MAG: hypothetical protein ACJ71N_02060 [Terriglobales bacterium]|jgi:hypothetical protein